MSRNEWFLRIRQTGSEWFEAHAPKGRYWADPFLAQKDGEMYLYFEDYDYNKGKLSFVCLDDPGATEQTALELPTHCSFPSVIELDGKHYMTPETVVAGELAIYEGWGASWTKVCVVANGRFDDPILHKRDGFYYLYTNEGGTMTVFRSANLYDGWQKIIADDRPLHRSAGHVFWTGSLWVRPMQDCTEAYGKKMVMVELESGRELYHILPDWKDHLTGCHTWNRLGEYEVMDGRIIDTR